MKEISVCRTAVRRRRGATLIDVAIGSMLLSLLLIPVVKMIGQSQTMTARLNDRDAMLFEAEQIVETSKLKLADPSEFDRAYNSSIDDITKVVSPSGKVYLAQLQVYPDKTMPSSPLASVDVTVWIDANTNARIDANETSETLRTQLARP